MTRKRSFRRKCLVPLSVLFIFLFTFGLGRKILAWGNTAWNGKNQLNIALNSKEGKLLLVSINPVKKTVVVLIFPANLEIEIPVLGNYQAKKLSLLAEQEKNVDVFTRGLGYFLGLPVDWGYSGSDLSVGQESEDYLRKKISGLFVLPRSWDFFRIWRHLHDRQTSWKIIDVEQFCAEEELADGTKVKKLDPSIISKEMWNLFTDPIAKDEGIAISILNIGEINGLGEKTASIIKAFGGRVVKVGDGDSSEGVDCLIICSKKELLKTATLKRLVKVFGCDVEVGGEENEFGGIQILVRNVKI